MSTQMTDGQLRFHLIEGQDSMMFLDMNQVANDVNSRGNVGLSHNIFNISWSPILCVHSTFYILLPNRSKWYKPGTRKDTNFQQAPSWVGKWKKNLPQLEVAMESRFYTTATRIDTTQKKSLFFFNLATLNIYLNILLNRIHITVDGQKLDQSRC